MPALNVLFTPRSKGAFAENDSVTKIVLPLDAVISEQHSFESRIATNPIEAGSDVTNHVFNDEPMLTITGVVTDAPVRILSGSRSIVEGRPGESPLAGAFFPEGLSRSAAALRALEKLRESRTPFAVVTGLKVYTNMVFKSLSIPRDASTGQTLRFTGTLQRIRIVESEVVEISPEQVRKDPPELKDQAASKRDIGAKSAQQATAETASRTSFIIDGLCAAGMTVVLGTKLNC